MVGQEDALAGAGQKAGGFRHEEHAAEHDVAGLDVGDAAGQFKGIAHDIDVFHHLVGLIVVAEDDKVGTVFLSDVFDAGRNAALVHRFSLKYSLPGGRD